MRKRIDLNSDLGESFGQWQMGDDAAMLKIVSSANIACGFHAGSPTGILATLRAAMQNNVVVGAHVAYPDLVGFGRRNMDLSYSELFADVIYQIGALIGLATTAGTDVRYVKPHGALYNTIAQDKRQAMAVIDAILALDKQLELVVLAGSPLVQWAKDAGLNTVAEAFADRAYHADGRLVSRQQAGAVLHDPQQVAERMVQLVQQGGLMSIEGQFTPIEADSICVHGDSPGAVEMARQLRLALEQQGITVGSFISATIVEEAK
ncbi:LamB/YcsF family protein [Moellerella wisconsensis]|uniref:5-oxoprolinase subunit A n=1 Tax=Moellerella wisconsensis ATCC 35017 TaxID=1354267 RepID=A0A0N1KI88_9GAMM|nr:5-oxoprolinase subunit PxpA [Moellerella wisconsensis]KPD02286.1 lactam utilization protein [Moellerella wisconsensis ATCC 35017]VFS53944.1 LamB/YcsF family protein [Moellerella wisconsensis]